jgi:hypothetical protein
LKLLYLILRLAKIAALIYFPNYRNMFRSIDDHLSLNFISYCKPNENRFQDFSKQINSNCFHFSWLSIFNTLCLLECAQMLILKVITIIDKILLRKNRIKEKKELQEYFNNKNKRTDTTMNLELKI